MWLESRRISETAIKRGALSVRGGLEFDAIVGGRHYSQQLRVTNLGHFQRGVRYRVLLRFDYEPTLISVTREAFYDTQNRGSRHPEP
jgi:hypothetical protein